MMRQHAQTEQQSPLGGASARAAAAIDPDGAGGVGRIDAPQVPPSLNRRHSGHGRKLTEAFEALEAFPALAESRDRLLHVVRADASSAGDVVSAVESDAALVIAVMRIANGARSPSSGRIASVPDAVALLGPERVEALARSASVFDFFERTPVWNGAPERFRLHAVTVQRAASMVARQRNIADADELMVSALLHDIGKLVLAYAYDGYPARVHGTARTPEERIHNERRELGVDHALVGGVMARRWNLPKSIATAIESHHAEQAGAAGTLLRLADMLAHYAHGEAVSPPALLEVARAAGLDHPALRSVMYELTSGSGAGSRRRSSEPCPLSARELEILRHLASGLVYKQIAAEVGLSTSTVRTHLHNVYAKLGAVDRAQAVLLATERGWL